MSKSITLWAFHDAPAVLRQLSTNGGDEDFLAIVPKELMKNNHNVEYLFKNRLGNIIDHYEYPLLPDDVIVVASHA